MKLEDLNPLLRTVPILNKIVMLANESIECEDRIKKSRRRMAITCLYHTVLNELFEESRKLHFDKRKKRSHYPILKYLSNVEIQWQPKRTHWKVTITNGKRWKKNRKVRHVLFVRKVTGKLFPFYIEENQVGEAQETHEK